VLSFGSVSVLAETECQKAKTYRKKFSALIDTYLKRAVEKSELKDAQEAIRYQLNNLNYELTQTENPNELNCQREWIAIHRSLAKLIKAAKGIPEENDQLKVPAAPIVVPEKPRVEAPKAPEVKPADTPKAEEKLPSKKIKK
jgi:DNA repair ATPase RecN